jgi:FAD/FMN-containing dehydrogenase
MLLEMTKPGINPSDLRWSLAGRVITPDDPEYNRARTVVAGGIDKRPAFIVKVANADDVARVVSLAREAGLELAIRSGGHSLVGHSVSDGGIVLDLSDMKAIEIDPAARTVWAETGLTAGELSEATAAHGLAIGFGDTASVGIGGITLGGGIGYLVRKYGLTIDNLLAAEIVTADGDLLRVNTESHPDLFWAIRGGGGNFGVVTRFQFRLHEVPSVVGGMLILPATPETIESFVALAEAAPEELSTIANVMPAPPMPFVPAEFHGKLVILALMCYAGDAEAGAQALAPFRALATPIIDMVRPIPYPQMYPPEEAAGEGDFHPRVAARTMFIDSLDRGNAETILGYLGSSDAAMRVAQIRVLGGAFARVPSEETAFAHRSRRMMVYLMSFYNGPQDQATRVAWVTSFAAALRKGADGAYVNFLSNEGQERIRAAYPGATWERLREVKAQYDPANLFRLNQNIPPASR